MVCHLHQLLSSLPWSPDVAKVAVLAMILKKDVDPLEEDMARIVANRVAMINNHVNANMVGE